MGIFVEQTHLDKIKDCLQETVNTLAGLASIDLTQHHDADSVFKFFADLEHLFRETQEVQILAQLFCGKYPDNSAERR
jgi:hypothetical protein